MSCGKCDVPEGSRDNYRAIILVGGYGTRLRPFTFTAPKPLVPFANQSIVKHQIEALVKAGVTEIVFAVNVQPDAMVEFMKKAEEEYNIKIHFSKEDVPMGTAGPLYLAREWLAKDDSPFFMLNSDVICEFPLTDLANFHKAHGGEGTVLVTEVKDPSKYGVVLHEADGKIKSFVEKPQTYVGNRINAGIYLLNPSVIKRIPNKPTSIEREIFPSMASDNKLYSMLLPGYWMDIGQPKDFITGTALHLDSVRKHDPRQLAEGKHIKGNVLVHPSARIGVGCEIGPDVVIGPNCVIDHGVRLVRTTLMEGVHVGHSAFISNSIIGWKSSVGDWARVDGCSLGADVQVAREIVLHELAVCPHKGVTSSSWEPGRVLL